MANGWVEAFPFFEVALERARDAPDADWRWIDPDDYAAEPGRPPRALNAEVRDEAALEALESLTALEELRLAYGWEVSPERLEVLTRLPALRTLSLSGVEVGAHLPVLPRLEELDLTGIDLSEPDHVAPLAGYAQLRVLDLGNSEVTADGLAHLTALPNLRALGLANTPLDEAACAHLRGMTRLTRLDLSDAACRDLPGALAPLTQLEELGLAFANEPDLSFLARLPRLRKLDLSDVEGAVDLTPLTGLTELRELTLVDVQLGPGGLAPLAGLARLEVLDLEETSLQGVDITPLVGLASLRKLRLSGCGVSAEALERLAALPHIGPTAGLPADCLVAFERDADPLEPEDPDPHDGWTWIPLEELADGGAPERPILAVDLQSSEVDDVGLRALAGLPDLELLNLSCCYELTDAALIHLAGMKRLRILDLSSTELTPEGLARLAELPTLEALNLDGVDLSRGGAEHLAGLTRLKSLDLCSTGLRAGDLDHLAGLTELIELDLSHTSCGAGLARLRGCIRLQKLNLSEVPLGEHPLAFLSELTALTELDLDGTGAGRADLSPLSGLTRLRRLDLSTADVADVDALRDLTALEDLDLEGCPRLTSIEPLRGLSALRSLDVTGTGVTSLSAAAELPALTELHAARAPLTDEGARLGAATALVDLDLSHTPITRLDGLTGCAGLLNLDLSGTQVTDESLAPLTQLPNLAILSLRGTAVTNAAIPTLAELPELGALNLLGTWVEREVGATLRGSLPGLELLQLPGDEAEYLASDRTVAGRPVRDYPSERIKAPAEVAYRVRASTYDPELPLLTLLDRLLAEPEAEELRALVIGSWEECYERSSEPIVEALVGRAARLPRLEALFLGDMRGAECELSWILQSDVSPLLRAFPGLTWFGVRGGNRLALSEPLRHERLETLVIETAGMPVAVAQAVAAAHLPRLRHLELWLGASADEDGVASSEHLLPILSGKLFPRLEHLALRNTDQADAIAQALAGAPVLDQLTSLDLSLSTLGDAGAEALLASPAIARLEHLDLQFHFMSEEVMAKFADLDVEVRLDDRQEGGDDWRYIAAGE